MSSGFVSSDKIEEERKARQAEWERVRKPDDPIEAPQAEQCNKSLFEQLKANKDKKDAEFAEARSFRNLIRGVDEDESDFLAAVGQAKAKEEARQKEEARALLEEAAAARVVKIDEQVPDSELNKLRAAIPRPAAASSGFQSKLLPTLIRKRASASSTDGPSPPKEAKSESTEESGAPTTSAKGKLPLLDDYESDGDDDDGDDQSGEEANKRDSSDSCASSSDSSQSREPPIVPLLVTKKFDKKAARGCGGH